LRRWGALAGLALIAAGAAQHLPSRDDPLYDYLARERPSPATLLRMPRSADEFLRTLPQRVRNRPAQIARWKLGDAP
jgi:hypothetical protein